MPRHLTEASATPNNTSHGGVGYRASDRRPHLLQMDSNSGSFSDDDLTFYSGVSMLSSQRPRVPKLRPSVSNTSGRSTSSKGSLRGKEEQLKNERNQQVQGIAEGSTVMMSTKSDVAQQNSFKSHDSSRRGRGRGTWLASLQQQKAEITKKVSEAQLSMQASMKSSDSIKSQRQNQSRTKQAISHKPSHNNSTQKVESAQAENQTNKTFMPILKLGTRRSRSWSPVRSIPSSDPASSSRSNDPISPTNSKKQIIRAPASRSTVLKTNLSGVSSFGNWDTVSVASSFFKAKRKPKLQEPEPEPDLVLSADSSISTRQGDPNFSLSQSNSLDGDETDGESTSTSGETVSPLGAKIHTPRNFFSGLFNNFIKSPEEPSELEEGIASNSEEEQEEQEMALSMSSDDRHGAEGMEEEGVEEEAATDTETEVDQNPDDANGNNDRNNDISKEPQTGVPKAQRMSLFSTTKKRLGQTSKEEPSDRTISTVPLDSAKKNETKGGIEVEVDPVISCRLHPPTLPKTPTTPKTPTRLSQIFGRKTPTSKPTDEEDSSSRVSINTPRLAQIFTRKSPRGAEDNVGASQPTPTRQKQCFGRSRNIKENADRLENQKQADGLRPAEVPTKETIAKNVDRSRASSQVQNHVITKREAGCETGTRRSASAPSIKSENKSRASVQSTRSLRRQLARKSRTQTISMDTAKELLSGKATIRIFDPSPKNASGNSDVWYRGRSYVQSKERESQEPRQHLVSVSKTALRKWLFFAKECIHEARTTSIDNLECNSSISSTDTAETEEVNSVLSQVIGDEEAANHRKDSSTKKGALDEVIERGEEVAEEAVTFQETKTDLGADSEEVDDLRSVSSFEVLFNCLTCSILPYDPNHHLNNDDDYFGGQISFTKINDHWKRVNSLRT